MNWPVFFFSFFFLILNRINNTFIFTHSTNIPVRLLTVNMKTSYPKKSENVRTHSSNYIENATSL